MNFFSNPAVIGILWGIIRPLLLKALTPIRRVSIKKKKVTSGR